jgi:hypothetical protein
LAVSSLLLTCTPQHTNPLDPDSSHYLPPPINTAPDHLRARVRSVHSAQLGTNAFTLVAEAWSEGNEVIDTAWVSYLDGTPFGLERRSPWSIRINESRLVADPHQGLSSVVGQPFTFVIRTSADSLYCRTPVYLFRVIEDTVQIVQPQPDSITGPRPVLEWQTCLASYPFTYEVRVYQPWNPRFGDTPVWQATALLDTTRQVIVSDSLEDGDYYWEVAMVDQFENSSSCTWVIFKVRAEGQQ